MQWVSLPVELALLLHGGGRGVDDGGEKQDQQGALPRCLSPVYAGRPAEYQPPHGILCLKHSFSLNEKPLDLY